MIAFVNVVAALLSAAGLVAPQHAGIVVAAYDDAPRDGQTCGGRGPGSRNGFGYHDDLPPPGPGAAVPTVVNINEVYRSTEPPASARAGSTPLVREGWYLEDDAHALWFVPDGANGSVASAASARATMVVRRVGDRVVPAHAVTLRSGEILAACWTSLGTVPIAKP
jgi:hypothetical protein